MNSKYYMSGVLVNIRYRCILLILKHWYKQSPLRADFDAMTSCSILFSCLKGDVIGAGRDVKRHCPSPYGEISNTFSSVQWYFFHCGCQSQRVCLRVAAYYVLWRISNKLDSHDGEERQVDGDGQPLHWDQPVATVMHSLDSDVNEHGTVTLKNFTANMLASLLIALICPSCSIRTQACFHP